MAQPLIGVIGGTGLGEALCADTQGESRQVRTPFGDPSGPILLTEWQGHAIAVLSRHGDGHRHNPSSVPYRANIFALKQLGVTHVLASGATGSLREDIHPRDLVVVDQVIDKTVGRERTFFERDIAVHVEFSQPFCPTLRQALVAHSDAAGTTVHDGGVYVCMEGPQFSTAAESATHRAWGGDVIGMTCLPEAKLAREAEMCYASVALVTDYDCWRPHDPGMNRVALLEEIMHNLQQASANAIDLIKATAGQLAEQMDDNCPCQDALALAVWSDKHSLDRERLRPLKPLLMKYVEL